MAFRFIDDEVYSNKQSISPMKGKFKFVEEETPVQEKNPKRSNLEKGLRTAAQFGLGGLEATPVGMVYEAAVSPLSNKSSQTVKYKENVMEDIERLQEQKQTGVWDEQDESLLNNLIEQIKNPEKLEQHVKTTDDLSIRGLASKVSGQDLEPEGVLEKAAHWTGFIKNPSNIKNLASIGLKPKEVMKAILPTAGEGIRGLSAGTALQMAEDGDFGPLGTLGAAVVGDLVGHTVSKAGKAAAKLVTQPKKALADAAASFTNKEKQELQKQIIKDFKDSGLQADLGTITDNNLIRWTQSRLAQSGFTGEALKEFRDQTTNQIKEEYKQIANELGESRFATNHEAGEVAKNGMKSIRDADLEASRKLYKSADKSLKERAFVDSRRLDSSIKTLEKKLKPGGLKSAEQSAVLNALDKLKQGLYDSEGGLLYADVRDLMNNKIALNDIINYEVQGGAKNLLKGLVHDIDRAIISHGKENASFAKNYINANKKFSEHAKTFRNKTVDQMLRSEDPASLLNKMNSIQGIRSMGKILDKSPQGKKIFEDMKRLKLDQIVGNNLVDSTTQQVKLGTFSKLLEKGKNRDLIKEILKPQDFKRLEKLQKNAGKLAQSAQEFYNASKSGVVAADAAILAQGMKGIASILMGNPWTIMKVAGTILAGKKLSKLLADPEFLKLVEDVILKHEKGAKDSFVMSAEKLRPYFLEALNSESIHPKDSDELQNSKPHR